MIDYNEHFEKVSYKNYIIDDIHNLKIIETLNNFIEITSKYNLSYILTGSLALSVVSKKVFRTWKDVDVVMDMNNIIDCMRIFHNQNHEWMVRNYNYKIIKLTNIKTNIDIEIVNYLDLPKVYIEKTINNTTLKVSTIDNIFYGKISRSNLQDMEDFKFYLGKEG